MPSLSDDQPLHQFDFKTLPQVPDSHAWPNLYDRPHGDDAIPVIDLRSPDAVRLIGRACQEWGAFQLTGHGVPVDLLDRLEEQMRRLFSLPAGQKLRAARSPNGATGYGVANIAAFFSKHFWSEGFTIVGSARDDACKLWPDDHDEFCCAMEEYGRRMKELARRVMLSMLLSLGLREEDVEWAGSLKNYDETAAVLQLNSYPACPDPERAMGLAEHTDSSLITILYQGSVSGLQLLHGEEPPRWVTVPPLPGALVVNVGDLSQIISNGRFRSVVHRVVVNRARARVSAAYFCGPQAKFKISPVEKLIGPERGPMYRGVTWPEYLSLKKNLYNEALASISLSLAEEKCEDGDNQAVCIQGEAKVWCGVV